MAADREQRYAAMFRAHHVVVWRYVSRRVLPDAVDDVVADTFLVAWRRFDDLPRDPLPLLMLTEWDGLPPRRAAVVLGIGAATARARIHRARKKLRTALAAELGMSLETVRSTR